MKIVPNNKILVMELNDCPWFSPMQPRHGVEVHIPVDGNGNTIPNRLRHYYISATGIYIGARKV